MKGLLKNNFLAVWSNARIFSAFMVAAGIFVSVVVSSLLHIGYVLLGIVGFPVIAMASTKRELASKWGKYKLTLPVKRSSIVKSYYISQLMWLAVGIFFSGAVVGVSWLIHGCPFDKAVDALSVLALGIGVSLFTDAVFFPLFYLGGEEKSEVSLVISLLCGIGISLGIVVVLNRYFTPGLRTILLGDMSLVIFAFLLFTLSYPLSVAIFKWKNV